MQLLPLTEFPEKSGKVIFANRCSILNTLKMGLLQVIVATVACHFLGFVWYTDQLPLGRYWLKHSSLRGNLGKDNVPLLVAFVCKIGLSVLLDDRLRFMIAGSSYAATATNALWLSAVSGLCFVTHAVFTGKGWPAILVDVSYDSVSLVVMALILVHL